MSREDQPAWVEEGFSAWKCDGCGQKYPGGILQTEKGRFCGSCNYRVNILPHACDPDDRCTEEGCDKRVSDHIAEFRALVGSINARNAKFKADAQES